MADSDTIYQAYVPRKESEASASDEDRLRREDLIHSLKRCEIPQQNRQFYLLDPTAWDWNYPYSSGLNDGVKVIFTSCTTSKPLWLKSDQQRAIFKQLRSKYRAIKDAEERVKRFKNRVEQACSDNDFQFLIYLLQAEDIASMIK